MSFWKKIFRSEKGSAVTPVSEASTSAVEARASQTEKTSAFPVSASDVFFSPLVTEKASALEKAGQYAFRVGESATKPAMARAVARRYGVAVSAVRMITMPGKERRRGRIVGWKPGFKKAIVTLKKGEKIEIS